MTHFLHTDDDLRAGLEALVLQDPRLKRVAEQVGTFRLRRRAAGFAGLCAVVCGQQLSTASADAIRARLFSAFDPFDHEAIRRARTEKLRRLGLSAAKVKSIRAIAQAVARGRIDLERVGMMDAEEARAALTALHGIGPWSADIYLLFCLGHSDAFPASDLAMQESARIAFGLPRRPDAKALTRMAETWRPWRGVAAHLLWAHYSLVKKREAVPFKAPARARIRQAPEKDLRNGRP